MSHDTIKYCLYARKSMEAEERQAMSIDSQVKEMQAIAERDGLFIITTKTEAHSAKSSGDRAVFLEMVNEIRSGVYNAILTWAPDRLSRNAGDLGLLVDLMDQGRLLAIQTYSQKFSNSPNDKFLLMILCSQAKLENDNKSENVKRGLRAKVEMGLLPRFAPIGYLDSKDKDRSCMKDIDPIRAPIIKEAFEKVAYEGWSGHDVLRWMHAIDFRTLRGKLPSLSTVQLMLRRSLYYGEFEYPHKSGKWYKGQHQPIITKDLYDRAQEQLAQYGFGRKHRKAVIKSFPFIKLMRCGCCGSSITAQEKRKIRKDGSIGVYNYYMCTRGKDSSCRELYINEADLVRQLLALFDQIELDLIGTRAALEAEIEKWYSFHAFVTNEPAPARSKEQKDEDLRKFAKAVFEDGTLEERREMLKHLKSKILLKDKKVLLA